MISRRLKIPDTKVIIRIGIICIQDVPGEMTDRMMNEVGYPRYEILAAQREIFEERRGNPLAGKLTINIE